MTTRKNTPMNAQKSATREMPVKVSEKTPEAGFRCGTVALFGRPNVGKSTLLNALVGQKLSITSRKPQTTRHRIRGILTRPDVQYVFVDTPGFQTKHRSALNASMNRGVRGALQEVDVVVFVVEVSRFDKDDRALLKIVPRDKPLILVVNKTDRVERPELMAFLESSSIEAKFAEIVPVSAQKKKGVEELLRTLRAYLPEQPAMYGEDELTDRDERFLASELLREKLFRSLGDEVPYGASVTIDKFELDKKLRRIHAAIVVDREGHKAIIIGERGEQMKRMATAARIDMEKLFGGKVYLEVWVKVRSGWTENDGQLKRLGYE
jgi:GTP-binding protein Era